MAKKQKNVFNFTSILKKDISILHKFMCWFSLIDGIKTNKALNAKYPPQLATDIINIFNRSELTPKASNEMSKALPFLTDTSIYYVVEKTKSICLLRHLRNAIAHDLLRYNKRERKFYIEDCNSNNKLTAFGVITADRMYDLMNMIFNKTGID